MLEWFMKMLPQQRQRKEELEKENMIMRKNFGAKPILYPQPVFIIGSYDEDGTPDAMNAYQEAQY